MTINRRNLLQLAGIGAVGAGTELTLPVARAASTMPGTTAGAVQKFIEPLPMLPEHRPLWRSHDADHYLSIVGEHRARILPGQSTHVQTYDGVLGGRVLRARSGRRVVIRQLNLSSVPVSVHLHGGVNPADQDGAMMDTIAPGSSRAYVYENDQEAATLWRHDHVHHADSENVYRGMSSPYLLSDSREDRLGLPSGRYDVPLMLRDAHHEASGELVYMMDDAEGRNVISVNGKAWPRLKVEARRYRFRFINSSNMRFFVLALADQSMMTQVAGDDGLLPKAFHTPVSVISPGERSEMVIDFSRYEPGTSVILKNLSGPGPMEDVGVVMRFDVGRATPDHSQVPEVLRAMPALVAATVRRNFVLECSETPGEMWGKINGHQFGMDDMDRIDTTVKYGATEEWTVKNANATRPHNFHTHLAHFRVVTRDGKPVGPDEAGWKDTVQIFPGQEVTLRLTFDRHRGVFPYHCHMLDHEAMGMMAQLRVV